MKTIRELKEVVSSVSYQTAFGCLVGTMVITVGFIVYKGYKKLSNNSNEEEL